MDMDNISMDIHAKSVDMDMDMDMDWKFHIHGNPASGTGSKRFHFSQFEMYVFFLLYADYMYCNL